MNFIDSFPVQKSTHSEMKQKTVYLILQKIYEQIDYNDGVLTSGAVTKGNFQWENGIKDSRVIFMPDLNGRFNISWYQMLTCKTI